MTTTAEGAHTRERILRAAAALFREKGVNGASMQDLATAVGVTKSSLYHHFASKQALLSEILELTVNRVDPILRKVASSGLSATERLHRAVETHIIELIRDQDNLTCFVEQGRYLEPAYMEAYKSKRDAYERSFRDIIDDGVTSGEFREVDVRLASMAILGMCNWMIHWYRPRGERKPAEIAEEFAKMAIAAIEAGR